MPQEKVARAGFAQLKSGLCLEEDGGQRNRDEVGTRGKKANGFAECPLWTTYVLASPKARASHTWPHGLGTHLLGLEWTPKLPCTCAKHLHTRFVFKMNAKFTF